MELGVLLMLYARLELAVGLAVAGLAGLAGLAELAGLAGLAGLDVAGLLTRKRSLALV